MKGKILCDVTWLDDKLYKGFTVDILDDGDDCYCINHPILSKPVCCRKEYIEIIKEI